MIKTNNHNHHTSTQKKHSQIAAIPSKLGDVAQDAVEQQKQKAVERDLITWPKMLKFGPRIDTKNDGVWKMNLCWLQNRVSTVSMLNFLGG